MILERLRDFNTSSSLDMLGSAFKCYVSSYAGFYGFFKLINCKDEGRQNNRYLLIPLETSFWSSRIIK